MKMIGGVIHFLFVIFCSIVLSIFLGSLLYKQLTFLPTSRIIAAIIFVVLWVPFYGLLGKLTKLF